MPRVWSEGSHKESLQEREIHEVSEQPEEQEKEVPLYNVEHVFVASDNNKLSRMPLSFQWKLKTVQ